MWCFASDQLSSITTRSTGSTCRSRQPKGPRCYINTLTPTKHVHEIIKKAHQKIAMFRMCFSSSIRTKLRFCTSHSSDQPLNIMSSVWSPYTKGNINLLEKVQRRCLCLCKKDIQIESLQERRLKTDLVDAYELINGLNRLQLTSFSLSPTHN